MFKDILVSGLLNTAVYALLATGFSLVFGVARILNFAHTAFYMVAAYLMFVFGHFLKLNLVISLPITVVLVALMSLVTYRFFVSRVRGREMAEIIVTTAIAFAIQEIINLVFGSNYQSAPEFISGYQEIAGVRITNQHIVVAVSAALALAGVWLLLKRTETGIAVRAISQDREAASLYGMNVEKMSLLTVAIGSGLAAFAGALVAPIYVLEPLMWFHPLIMTLAIVLFGGLGSLKGTLFASVILGFTETLVVFLFPAGSFLKNGFAFAVILLVLMFRPSGLYGVSFEEERL